MTVPLWTWFAFAGFVVATLALDLFVLHRRAHEVSLREAGIWTVVWVVIGLGFGGLLWAWAGGHVAQAYLAGYLIEKSLSLDNVFGSGWACIRVSRPGTRAPTSIWTCTARPGSRRRHTRTRIRCLSSRY